MAIALIGAQYLMIHCKLCVLGGEGPKYKIFIYRKKNLE